MADYEYITLTGTVVPDVSTIYQDVVIEFKAAFGQDLVTTTDTPQGVLITAETSSRISVARNNATLANQINPNIAGGVYLDAIWALTGGARTQNTRSVVLCNLTGVPGTNIPSGVQASTSAGDIFESVGIVTLDSLGNASINFQSVQYGPIPALANTLTNIAAETSVLGWETITNPDDATLGTLTQSDESARFYRKNELALQGQSISQAISSGLYSTPGVTSSKFLENIYDTTKIIDNVTMVPHSMYACVSGGTDIDVATTILSKKNVGCNYNNGAGIPVSVTIIDPYSGQPFTILFDRPTIIPILVRATVKAASSVANPVASVQQAVLDYAAGLINGLDGFVVAGSVSPFEISGAITIEVPGIYVQKLEVSLFDPVSYQTTEIFIEKFQQASVTRPAITVIIAT